MLLIKGGLAIGPDGVAPRDVLIDGETFVAVDERIDPPTGTDVLDAGGAYVIPGGIDPHTHLDLPVGAVRSADDFASGTVAAACGGTTCVVDFAGAGRESPVEALEAWHEKAGGSATIDYGFHLTVTSVPEAPDQALALFRSFVEAGVTSVKLYLAYPDRLMVDAATLGRAFRAAREAGVLVCVHAEDGSDAERRTAAVLAEGETSPAGHPRARPPEVEAAAIRTAADLAGAEGAAVYVVHLSGAVGLAEVRAARDRGVAVLAETCPQYLFLTDETLGGAPEDAIDFMCTPPLRADADREALWGALADGSLQAVSTDHCPFTRADRRRGTGGEGVENFTQVPGGLPGTRDEGAPPVSGRPRRQAEPRTMGGADRRRARAAVRTVAPQGFARTGSRRRRRPVRPGGRALARRERAAHAHRPQPVRGPPDPRLARRDDQPRDDRRARRRAGRGGAGARSLCSSPDVPVASSLVTRRRCGSAPLTVAAVPSLDSVRA